MSLCRPERDEVPMIYWELILNPRWVQDLNRDNVPCLRSIPDIPLPNPPVFIKMMLFDQEVGPSIKGGMWQEGREGGERLMSATVKQRKTRVGKCYLETRGGSPRPRS
jgi:hypothetical protein